jgi:hypothetical protein
LPHWVTARACRNSPCICPACATCVALSNPNAVAASAGPVARTLMEMSIESCRHRASDDDVTLCERLSPRATRRRCLDMRTPRANRLHLTGSQMHSRPRPSIQQSRRTRPGANSSPRNRRSIAEGIVSFCASRCNGPVGQAMPRASAEQTIVELCAPIELKS